MTPKRLLSRSSVAVSDYLFLYTTTVMHTHTCSMQSITYHKSAIGKWKNCRLAIFLCLLKFIEG